MLLAVIIVVPCLIGGGYSQNFATYAILRYISCTVIVFGWIANHSIKMEYISRNKRAFIMALDGTAAYILGLTLPLIAYFHRHWTSMHVWAGIAAALALPTTFFGVPESARWLIANNRAGQAEKTLKDIARGNGKELTEQQWNEVRTILSSMKRQKGPSLSQKLNIWHLFQSTHLKITLIMMLQWVSMITTNFNVLLLTDTFFFL